MTSTQRYLTVTKWLLRVVLVVAALSWSMVLLNQANTTENWIGVLGVVLTGTYAYGVAVRTVKELKKKERVVEFLKSRGLLAVFLVAGCAMLSSNCTRIDAGEVGIKINYAGTYRGISDLPLRTGWVSYWPMSSKVFEYPTYVQNVVWTKNLQEGPAKNEEITFTNADQMTIAVDISMAYHLDATKVPAFYLKFRNDDLDAFTFGFMHNVARDQFNAIGGHYHMDQIMGDNGPFIKAVRDGLQSDLGQYGVVIDQFGIIGAPRPPQSVLDSITAKVKAQQIAIQKENEVAQATADANKAVAEAEGYAKSVEIRADADTDYNKKVSASLTPLLVQAQAIKQWNGILPSVSGGATPFISLPAGK